MVGLLALSWLAFAIGWGGGAPAASAVAAERQALAAKGQELVLPIDQRRAAFPIQLQTASFGDSSVFDLAAHRGNIVVLFFMAAWCPTCVPEAEALARLYDNYAADGVSVLVLDVDQRETEEHLSRFRERAGNGRHLWAMDTGHAVARPYQVRALDTTIVIDRDRRIAYKDNTPTRYETLTAVTEALLR